MELGIIKEKISLKKVFITILLFALGSFLFLCIKGNLNFLNGFIVFFIPFAWSGYAMASVILIWIIISCFILKRPYHFIAEWGARLLALVACAELMVWIGILIKGILQNGSLERSALEELIFPFILTIGLLVLSLVMLKRNELSFKRNVVLLLVAMFLFIIPRESGDLSWNLTRGKSQTSTESNSSSNVNTINWGDRSKIPADYGAKYLMVSSGIGGPTVGRLLKEQLSPTNQFAKDIANVTVMGSVKSSFLGTLFPFLKWGTVTADLTIDINYGISTFEFDTDNSDARSLNFSSSIDLHIKSKRVLFGIASVRNFNEKFSNEIYSIVEKSVKKELGY